MNSKDRIMSSIALKQPDWVPFTDYTEDLMRSMLLGREQLTEMEFANSILYGSVDAQMNYFAMTELSQHYEVPNFSAAGRSNAPFLMLKRHGSFYRPLSVSVSGALT